jgi:hypothetical protein|uniref:Uncharacterized protein n=1 Tax=Pleomorphic virus ThalV2 TaxID=3115753 RepID=A0AAT9JAJ1_9VIRU
MSERKSWNSFDEFKNYVNPYFIDHRGPYDGMMVECLFNNMMNLTKHFLEFYDSVEKLERLVRSQPEGERWNKDILTKTLDLVETISSLAEYIFLYFPELAKSRYAYDFLYAKDLHLHWERYSQTRRIEREIKEYLRAAKKLLDGFYELTEEFNRFLMDEIKDLPPDLQKDFRVARDLFSVGMEEQGVFAALRGLEGVLRRISKNLGVTITKKGKDKQEPLHEQSLADLTGGLYRVRWKDNSERVITQEIKSLVDFLRNLRNKRAHPDDSPDIVDNWREIAITTARAANKLWKISKGGKREVESTRVVRDW